MSPWNNEHPLDRGLKMNDGILTLSYRSRDEQFKQMHMAVTAAGDLDNRSVCDFGCGYGDLIAFLPKPVEYTGVERHAGTLEHSRRLYPGYTFIEGFTPVPADVVFAIAVLQGVHTGGYRELFNCLWGYAKETLVCTCPKQGYSWMPEQYNKYSWWDDVPNVELEQSDSDFMVVSAKR